MPVAVESARFGPLEVADDQVLEFPHGLIGIPGTRYVLLSREGSAFAWLQSLDDAEFAVPVTVPWQFFADFQLGIGDGERELLGLAAGDEPDVLVIVRAAARLEDCTANLRAPIALAGNRAAQVLNDAPGAALRVPLAAPAEPEALNAA